MNRRHFIGTFTLGAVMGGLTIKEIINGQKSGPRMPAIFIGHGSPMNAIDSNNFTHFLEKLGGSLPRPKAILTISAHWMTKGSWLTQMEKPRTIHDFYGFPQALFDVQYPAPGAPELAPYIQKNVSGFSIRSDTHEWGLDHGTWSVLRHMYPDADIPVLQLSLDMTVGPDYHYKIGQELLQLREKGILILGSGNLVHNLRQVRWEPNAPAYDWALEFDSWIKQKLDSKDAKALQYDFLNSEAGKLANPSLDHYLPMLYTLGAGEDKEDLRFIYEEIQNASISMRSFQIG